VVKLHVAEHGCMAVSTKHQNSVLRLDVERHRIKLEHTPHQCLVLQLHLLPSCRPRNFKSKRKIAKKATDFKKSPDRMTRPIDVAISSGSFVRSRHCPTWSTFQHANPHGKSATNHTTKTGQQSVSVTQQSTSKCRGFSTGPKGSCGTEPTLLPPQS
jgi:hypothetical protein